jgi:hypothetical protein
MKNATIQSKETKMTAMKSRSMVLATGVLIFVAALLVTGCSVQSPVGPNVEPTPEPDQPHVLSRSAASVGFAQGSPINMYNEAMVSAKDGGRLQVFDVVLEIPAGALDVDTVYSINIPDISVFYNEFGTDGLVFKQPVTVTMSYRNADLSGVDESTIRIGWWDEEHGKWLSMDCELDRVNQVVVGKLYHFSAYALVSD